jgi:hypothetical protein
MTTINSFADANLAIALNYNELRGLLDKKQQAALDTVVSTTIMPEKVSHFFELCYAVADHLTPELKEVAASIGNFAWSNGFYGLSDNMRGTQMERILRGETISNSPTPKEEFVTTPESTATVAPATI